MSIYKRDDVLPEWEPVPWDLSDDAADKQELEFHARATKTIVWQKIQQAAFSAEGIFGHAYDWFDSNEIAFFATLDGEDLILIHNIWFGFPDPPEWGLASRPTGARDLEWIRWGHFPDLPKAWKFPDGAP